MKIAILGVGKFGHRVLEALIDGDYSITLVDKNEEKLNNLSMQYDVLTYVGDVNRVSILKKIAVDTYDAIIVCTSSDDTNIFVASSAKALGCKKVIARVTAPEHMHQTDFIRQHFHIDAIINPDMLITGEMYRYLVEKYSLSNGVYTNKRIAMLEIEASKEPRVVGKPITEFRNILPNTLVVGICRHGTVIIPHGEDKIEANDILYLVGEKKEMLEYAERFTVDKIHSAQNVMIIGGGRTGYFLARKLSEYGSLVKIIESDRKRCEYLAGSLKNVMVINGSGTDIRLLDEENFDEMDAVVTTTGIDEENILLALAAKNRGVEDVISKVSHDNYEEMKDELGIDVILNPLDISTSAIMRIISGSKRVLSSVLLQGQAELLEIYVDSNMGMINKKLCDLDLPEYAIVAAINRGTKTIIPKGEDTILPGDHLIIVCLISHIGYIEQLIKPVNKLAIKKPTKKQKNPRS